MWKDVYLVASAPAAAAITYVVPQIFYQARLPISPLYLPYISPISPLDHVPRAADLLPGAPPSSFYASAYATAQHARAHKGVAR